MKYIDKEPLNSDIFKYEFHVRDARHFVITINL